MAPTVLVTLANGQRVYVSSDKSMGSFGGASGMFTAICYQPQGGGALSVLGNWMAGAVPANTLIPFGATVVWTAPAGSYNTGLCANVSVPANWNYNDWGYTSALVFQP